MRKQYGLSLIELMISITLGLVLMAGVVQMFLSSKTVFSSQQGMSRIQETGRLAIEFMSHDIRMAAYYGCYRPSNDGNELRNKTLVISGLHGNFDEGIRGYDKPSALPGGAASLGTGFTLLPEAKNTQNIVIVRTANEVGFPVVTANTATSVFGYTKLTALENGCANSICPPIGGKPGSAVVITDCSKARVFQVSGVSLAANELTITHSDAWGLGPLESFVSGEALPMNTTIYFLAQRTGANNPPSLWQKTNTDAALELLEGVEHMRATYATSDNTTYRLASALASTDWPKVTSVRLDLVVRSIENYAVAEKQTYTFPEKTEITPADGDLYMRQVFNVTVGIRNRAVNVQ